MSAQAGSCDPRFAAVGEAFAANLDEEIGAALAVQIEGRTVVNLWGGWEDSARTQPWQPDTVVDVFSTGKAFVALIVLALGLELDRPAWQDATLRQVLAHQAGQPAIRVDVPAEAIYDWDWMVRELECQEPWWQPGTAHGYHVNTFGFLCGEIVRRETGERIAAHLARLAGSSRVRFGAPPGARVAEFVFDIGDPTRETAPQGLSDQERLMLGRAYFNPPGLSGIGTVNSEAWRGSEIPSANMHASARGLVEAFSRMVGAIDVDRLAEARYPWSQGVDLVLRRETWFGLGFQLSQPDRPMGPGLRSYGHFGAGGSLAFHDPERDLFFAYVCNRCEGRRWQTTRNRRLLDALGESLGG